MANLLATTKGFLQQPRGRRAFRLLKGTLLGGLLGLVFAHCGGGGGTTLTADQFCVEYAQNECSRTATLCGIDATACETARKAKCNTMIAAWQTGPRFFHPGKAGNCLSQVKNIYTHDFVTPDDFKGVNETCNRVFSGDVAMDQTCTSDYDCADPMICDKGVCEKKVTKGPNELCNDPGAVCGTGYDCLVKMDTTVRACLAKKGTNDPCTVARDCKEDLRCLNGACAMRVDPNGECTTNDDCKATAPFCDTNLAAPRCIAGLRFSPGGTDCNPYGASNNAGTGGAGGVI